MASKMMRPHRKVRTGCLQCKARRIKCDEQQPKCKRCTRYFEDCTYPSAIAINPEPEPEPELTPETTTLTLSDLELLHQWTTQSYAGFTETPSGDHTIEIWQSDIPRLALQYPFLMRGILGISALHLSLQPQISEERKQHYLSLASQHQSIGLRGYRHILSSIPTRSTTENSYAVVTFGHITCAYAFACPRNDVLRLDWMSLVQGCRNSMREEQPVGIDRHPHEAFIYNSTRYLDALLTGTLDLSLNSEDWSFTVLEMKMQSVLGVEVGEEEMEVYKEMLRLWRRASALPFQSASVFAPPGPGLKFSLSLWVECVSQRYMDYIAARRPMALVLLAHVCVGIKRVEHCWYIRGEAERIMGGLEETLVGEWRAWIEWPREKIASMEREIKKRKRGELDVGVTDGNVEMD